MYLSIYPSMCIYLFINRSIYVLLSILILQSATTCMHLLGARERGVGYARYLFV